MNTNYNNDVAGALKLITINGSVYQLGKDASASEGGIMKLYSTVNGENTDGAVSQAALKSKFDTLESGASLSVEKDGTAVENAPEIGADGHTYTIKQGNDTLFTLAIAQDMVVSDGEVIVATGNEKTTTDGSVSAGLTAGERYIMLQLANSTKLLYVPVNSLYKDYTFNDSTEISFTDSNNVVSADIKSGSIAKAKLSQGVQDSLDLADSALQSHQDISGKADKVANPIVDNFAKLDANGNLVDAGVSAASFQPAGSYKILQQSVTNIAGDADKTIASLTQTANGEISYTMQAIQEASASQHGLMTAAQYAKVAAISASVSGDTLTITTQAAA